MSGKSVDRFTVDVCWSLVNLPGGLCVTEAGQEDQPGTKRPNGPEVTQ